MIPAGGAGTAPTTPKVSAKATTSGTGGAKTGPPARALVLTDDAFMPCPDGPLLDLAAQVAENDARAIFLLLWRAIAHWHLQSHLEETA